MSDVDRVRDAFVQLWGSMGPLWGVPPTTARVFGYLFARAESANADQIGEELALSRGAVSMAVRELRDWGLVHVDRGTEGRALLYRPEADIEKAVRNIVATRKRREWDPILSHLREWIPRLEADRSAEAAVLRERLREIEALVALADTMAETFLEGGLLQGLGLKLLVARAGRKHKRTSARAKRSGKR